MDEMMLVEPGMEYAAEIAAYRQEMLDAGAIAIANTTEELFDLICK